MTAVKRIMWAPGMVAKIEERKKAMPTDTEPNKLYITGQDYKRLQALFRSVKTSHRQACNALIRLEKAVNQAIITLPAYIPSNVVTIYSRFVLRDLSTGSVSEYTLVFPGGADIEKRKISILAPLGATVIGHMIGDTIDYEAPIGILTYRIESIVHQPETDGEF